MDTSKSSRQFRRKIEVDLLARFQGTKRKLDKMKKKRIQEELRHNQSAPRINSLSRKIANGAKVQSLYSPNRLQRTHEILKNSRFMPKKVKLSLHDLNSISTLQSPRVTSRYDTAMSTSRTQTPLSFPSLKRPISNKSSESLATLPADISMRNELLFGLRKETTTRGFEVKPDEPPASALSFHERTQKWLKRKREKIEEQKEKNEKKAIVGCTFKPELKTQRVHSTTSTQRTLSSGSSYSNLNFNKNLRSRRTSSSKSDRNFMFNSKSASEENTARIYKIFNTTDRTTNIYSGLCPVPMDVKYGTGYSNSLRKKARPMFNYKSLSINS